MSNMKRFWEWIHNWPYDTKLKAIIAAAETTWGLRDTTWLRRQIATSRPVPPGWINEAPFKEDVEDE